MDQSYEFFLALHLYSLYASGFLMLFYLILTQGNFKTEFIFIRRIRLFLPIYYLFLALIIFTGCLLSAMKQFQMNVNIWVMIFSWILIFALAIFAFFNRKISIKCNFCITSKLEKSLYNFKVKTLTI